MSGRSYCSGQYDTPVEQVDLVSLAVNQLDPAGQQRQCGDVFQ